jgi:hypothetical protein
VEWRLVLKAAAFAGLAVLAANLLGGGSIELVSMLAGFGLAGYVATHRARRRPLVQGIVTVALALSAVFVGVAVAEGATRPAARSIIVLTPFAVAPGAVGILAGRADRELRPRSPDATPSES